MQSRGAYASALGLANSGLSRDKLPDWVSQAVRKLFNRGKSQVEVLRDLELARYRQILESETSAILSELLAQIVNPKPTFKLS